MKQKTYVYAVTPQYHEITGYAMFHQELDGPRQRILAEKCVEAREAIQKQMRPYSIDEVLSRALMQFRYHTGIPGYVVDPPIAGNITF